MEYHPVHVCKELVWHEEREIDQLSIITSLVSIIAITADAGHEEGASSTSKFYSWQGKGVGQKKAFMMAHEGF